MRVVVDIPDAYQELIKELEDYGPRQRAGRLRMLATMGLMTLNGGGASPSAHQSQASRPSTTGREENEANADQQKARSDMGLRMMGSLNR